MSYEQGIEKAAKILRYHNEGRAVFPSDGASMARAAVEAFLSAQPTIFLCATDNRSRLKPSVACSESDGCEWVRIVERETP